MKRTLFMVAVTAVLVTACGGGDSGSPSTTPEVSTTVSLAPSTSTLPSP
jgi:hypothetical protein